MHFTNRGGRETVNSHLEWPYIQLCTYLYPCNDYQSTVELQSNNGTILSTTDDDSVEISCEMKAFIHPDSSLIWEGLGGQRITGSSKHHITFTNGLPMKAADGSDLLVPSRVSTLTIFDPEPSDTGTYTCSVMGTDQTVTVKLVVVNATVNTDTTPNLNITDTVSVGSDFVTNLNITAVSIGSVIAVIGLLTIAAVAALCFLRCARNRRHSRAPSNNPVYDYPTSTVPGLNDDNRSDQSATTSSVEDMKKNEAYDVATEYMAKNKAYGVATDGISTTEKNVAYGVATDLLLYIN